MTIAVFNESFVGISELAIKRAIDGLVINAPIPANFVIQENKTQKIQRTKSRQGRTVRASSYITGEEPTLTISYNHMQPELMAFKLGNQFEQATYDIELARTIEVTQNTYAGAVSGDLGFGMPADQAFSSASTRPPAGLSAPLTRVAYSSFNASSTRTFAQGADGALKFSNDLVAAKEVVKVVTPHEVTGLALGDGLIGVHSIVAHLVDTQNQVWVFYATNVTNNVEGSAFDPSAETLDLPFFLNNPPGACRSWNLYSTNEKVNCA